METALPEDLVADFGDTICVAPDGAWEITVAPEAYRASLERLGRDRTPPYDYLLDLFGVDLGDDLEVIIHLGRALSPEVVRVKTRLARQGPNVPTVTDIWPGAAWPEREMMEMYGISVEGHPDPRHLLLPEGWKGYPLRKDYQYPTDNPYLTRDPLHEGPVSGEAET